MELLILQESKLLNVNIVIFNQMDTLVKKQNIQNQDLYYK